ncbi:hypothetical protein GCM10010232_38680 [Streptomyces amakusaensis]
MRYGLSFHRHRRGGPGRTGARRGPADSGPGLPGVAENRAEQLRTRTGMAPGLPPCAPEDTGPGPGRCAAGPRSGLRETSNGSGTSGGFRHKDTKET